MNWVKDFIVVLFVEDQWVKFFEEIFQVFVKMKIFEEIFMLFMSIENFIKFYEICEFIFLLYNIGLSVDEILMSIYLVDII